MLCLALLFLNHSKAQTINYSTGNLLNNQNWTGATYGPNPNNCCSGGPAPLYDTGTNIINFSYGQANVSKTIGIAQALANSGSGITVTGYNYNWDIRNLNGDNRQGSTDTLNASVVTTYPNGSVRRTDSFVYNTKFDWTTFHGTINYTTPGPTSEFGNLTVNFSGKDSGYWAGYYGPQIRNVELSLNYATDPCKTNPAYSPNCSGFNNVLISNNLVPNPNASTSWGGAINNSFAIQTALKNSGSGLIVHGFDYGYTVNATQSYCEAEFIICWSWHSGGSVQVNAGITNAKGQNIYSISRNYNESGYSNEKFAYRFPTSTNQTMLGNFNFTASTNGDAYVGNMYSRMVYSQDPCTNNPNYLPTCTNKVTATYTAPSITSSQTSKELSSTGTVSVNAGGVQLSTTGTISAPDNIPQTIKDTQASAQQSQVTATINQPQQVTKTPTLSSLMSIISQVQANDKATQAMAVQNANKVVAASTAQSQEQVMSTVATLNAMSVASIQTTQDIAPVQISTISSQPASSAIQLQTPSTTSLQNLMSMAKTSNEQPMLQPLSIVQQQITANSVIEIQAQQAYQPQNFITVSESITTPTYQLLPTNTTQTAQQVQLPVYQEFVNMASEFTLTTPETKIYLGQMPEAQQVATFTIPTFTNTKESISFTTKSENKYFESDVPLININSAAKGNSITEIAETRANIDTAQNEQNTETVKKNVQSNELAGGVDIAAMAIQPKGFDVYSTLVIKDSAFYAPKEIYGNQKTIDNVRLLRSLSNDRLHQEMVEQQYRR